uniref:Uncharacterized protein n=1 Tax=Kwoniella dejecticola CBS 10117 TaxID=1296121 RepID=A0A1A6A1X1_9TREE|nr:uncharacterized protein I303_06326 [Kwoniella dejecticola CBS 10117]OBR84039.1 hypothetical protein I303_06326 [Kwoniella dejecticola CBS 10117]
MPPAVRKQPSRNTLPQPSASGSASAFASASTSNPVQQSRRDDALSDFQRRRLARRLDELERTNPTDIPATSFIPQSQAASALHPTANANANKKKQSANVRRILYGKKSLKDWLDELLIFVITSLLFHGSSLFLAPRPAESIYDFHLPHPSQLPAQDLFILRVYRRVQMSQVRGMELR